MLSRRAPIRRLSDERGQSLVLALLVMTALGVTLATVMFFTTGNQRTATRQKAAQVATSLAESGVNNAVSVLAQAAVPGNAGNTSLIPPGGGGNSTLLPADEAHASSKTFPDGSSVKWWGTVNNSWLWTLYGKATVPHPTGSNSSSITKLVTAQVQVNQPAPSSFNVAVWNTVYSPFGPTTGCDTTIGQGINIAVPVYVGGNLCMGQNAVITKPVYVGGFLFFQNKQGSIGSTGARINSAHVGGYCQVSSGAQVNPCTSEPVGGSNPNTNIWVNNPPANLTGIASDFVGITPPSICWGPNSCTTDPDGGWYTVSAPGPLHPCTTVSGTPPTFDTNTSWDNSVASAFNLTPAASYTCQTPQGGQLSWNATTRTLTVAGTIFIDGPVTMTTSGNTPILYTGTGSGGACTQSADCQAVIFASGDINIDSEKLCAKLNSQGSDCDWNNWDPNKKLLIFASNGPTGITVGPSQTSFQGGLYATNTVASGQGAVTEGPLVSGTKTVILGQQFGGTFPPITILPLSINSPPGNFSISPPTNFCYGPGCPTQYP